MINIPTKKEVLNMRTLVAEGFDKLKYEDNEMRIWVSDVEVMRDGSPQVTVELLADGVWVPDEIF